MEIVLMSRIKKVFAIIGEGETEWYYFNRLNRHENYSFKVKPELPYTSHWSGIIDKAVDESQNPYDRIFCVLDVDDIIADQKEYQRYKTRVSGLQKKKKTRKITMIETMPCIEYWFLLHYRTSFSTKEYQSFSELKHDLLKAIPDYEKKITYFKKCDFYKKVTNDHNLENAMRYARMLEDRHKDSDSRTFPYSDIFKLVEGFQDA